MAIVGIIAEEIKEILADDLVAHFEKLHALTHRGLL